MGKKKNFFNKDSALVALWVRLIHRGAKTLEDVPYLLNLHEVVAEVLEEEKEKEVLPLEESHEGAEQ